MACFCVLGEAETTGLDCRGEAVVGEGRRDDAGEAVSEYGL